MLIYLLAIFVLRLHSISAANNNVPIVEINNGKLLGLAHDNYYSFEGIPYAEPPIGENRFESPKPYMEIWNTTFDSTKIHEHCIQYPDPISRTYEINGIEDCLYLNIYTPDIYNNAKLYPVVFYIHGGAYMYGSGDSLRENILMKHQNVIYVTFNYRLNIFGFLSTSDTSITGNMGLKDQRLALKWVKENIQKFNGNPEKILIAGFSAGSASVEYMTLQSDIENYAAAAIGMSGSVLNPWAFNPNPKISAIELGKHLNCGLNNNDSIDELKNCLKTKSAIDIVSKVKYFRNLFGTSVGIFTAVAEHESVPDAIIRNDPRELIKMGKFNKIPLLLSYTAEDGALLTSSIYKNIPDIIKTGNKYFLANTTLCKENCSNEYLEEIFDDLTKNSLQKLTEFFTNRLLKNGIIESLNIRRNFIDSQIYMYSYDNPAPFGLGNLIAQRNDVNFGTTHGDDVFLIFNMPARDYYEFRPDEERISDNLVKMLESFVTTGLPVFGDIEIPRITADKFEYLHIKADNYQIESVVNEDNSY